MSRVADMLIDVVEKVMEKLNLDNVDNETSNNIQDWVMEHAQTQQNFSTLSTEELANQFIQHNVCPKCLTFTYGNKCSCQNRSEIR